MKQRTLLVAGLAGVIGLMCAAMLVRAQARPAAQRYEVATIKWDGGDRVQIMTPSASEVIRIYQSGGQRVIDIPEEEYCLTWAANKLAHEGWESVNLNNRRILMQRPISR